MLTNLVSLQQLQRKGIWWDTRPEHRCLRRKDNSVLCKLLDRYNQFVLEYIPLSDKVPKDRNTSAFVTRRNKINSWTKRRRLIGDALRWHYRLGHPGPNALEHLVNCSTGVRLRGPTTVQCEVCAQAKITRQIRRQARPLLEGPAERLAIDFHDYQEGLGGYTSVMLITDRYSGLAWDYYLTNRKANTVLTVLQNLFKFLSTQFRTIPKVIECDDEVARPKVISNWLLAQGTRIEPSAPNTQAQNGGAERSGGIIKEKSLALGLGSKFQEFLWPEVVRAAVYLYNRTPKYIYN